MLASSRPVSSHQLFNYVFTFLLVVQWSGFEPEKIAFDLIPQICGLFSDSIARYFDSLHRRHYICDNVLLIYYNDLYSSYLP
jgi:hypothetical protein